MKRYFTYVLVGLVLMAPQELVTAVFKSASVNMYIMSLVFWAVMLSLVHGISRITKNIPSRWEVLGSGVFYALVGISIEWGLLNNSPWMNSGANQVGLVAGWVSVLLLPRVFLDDKHEQIRKWSVIWYCVFVASVLLPLLLPNGSIKAVTIYGYTVIPFLLLSLWYVREEWKKEL